jgi:hypothetical protein
MTDLKVSHSSQATEPHHRVDTEHRGVAGTLVLSDTLDEKVIPRP